MLRLAVLFSSIFIGLFSASARGLARSDGVMMQYFHWYLPAYDGDKGLWKVVEAQAPLLAKKGFSSLWLPPAYKGAAGIHDVGYSVYDRYDFGEFNQKGTVPTRYGTRQQYQAAIAAAHRVGLNVYADMVMNHMMGSDRIESAPTVEVDPRNRNREIQGTSKMLSVPTAFQFSGRGEKYSSFTWNWKYFTGLDQHEIDQFSDKQTIYKFRGNFSGFQEEVDHENGNYDYLMGADLDMRHPDVRNELMTWGKWYIRNLKIDGFRLDAVKHIPFQFIRDWSEVMQSQSQNPLQFFMVGEYWSADVSKLRHYIDVTGGHVSLFDAPLHFNFAEASNENGNYDMRKIFAQTLVENDPVHSVTFIDNHDTQPLQSLQSPVASWFKPLAYALILLRSQGYPCVFYADYYGATYADHGQTVKLPSFQKTIDQQLYLRMNYAYGAQRDYFDHWDVVGWTREGDTHHGAMAVLVNDGRTAGAKKMCVGKQRAGRHFVDFTHSVPGSVTVDVDGCGEFGVNAKSFSAWTEK